ncbi:helix-hairpin-helix domain-containing protein [Sphaerisporangium melleum]|uniref:ComEA family DNA-binding protein n=1 Tax=Sphaerisporangium melleum TaxID=321316 RepID=UPI001E4D1F59|nr:ComEA family DNA-binding protein [Sphaerisporangium melleum]
MLLVLALLAAIVGGVLAWRARPEVQPLAPPTPVAGIQAFPVARPTPAPDPTRAGEVVVHVTGKVRKPGLVTLSSGSRVADALTAAGGVRSGAKTGALNLARKLVDGEQIVVGPPVGQGMVAPQAAGSPASADAPLDLNTATPAQLETLPGVGEVLAGRIVEFRQSHAGFRSIDELRQVTGIGDRKFADLRDKVHV